MTEYRATGSDWCKAGIGVYTVEGENVDWVAIITVYFRKKTLRKRERQGNKRINYMICKRKMLFNRSFGLPIVPHALNYRKLKYIFYARLNGYVNKPSAFGLGKSPYVTVFI